MTSKGATGNTAPTGPAPQPLPLVCVYCGATLFVNQETVGSAYLTYEKPESIECDASDCGAVWEPDGSPRETPRWVRYPDLYQAPDRVHGGR